MLLVLTTNTVFSIATIMLGGGIAMINDLCQDINIMSGRVLYVTEQLLHTLFHALFLAPLALWILANILSLYTTLLSTTF